MRNISIELIKLYQKISGPWHNYCRYSPTCSNYTIEALKNYGFFKGWFLGIKRILRCNPWGDYGYDPVPKKDLRVKKFKSSINR